MRNHVFIVLYSQWLLNGFIPCTQNIGMQQVTAAYLFLSTNFHPLFPTPTKWITKRPPQNQCCPWQSSSDTEMVVVQVHVYQIFFTHSYTQTIFPMRNVWIVLWPFFSVVPTTGLLLWVIFSLLMAITVMTVTMFVYGGPFPFMHHPVEMLLKYAKNQTKNRWRRSTCRQVFVYPFVHVSVP